MAERKYIVTSNLQSQKELEVLVLKMGRELYQLLRANENSITHFMKMRKNENGKFKPKKDRAVAVN